MKKVLVILALLAVTGIASADWIVDGATNGVPTLGWMNVEASEGNWGSAWGLADVRTDTAGYVTLQTNVNGADDNPGDPYWNPPGHLGMEGNSYIESGWGEYTGQNITFNFTVLSNNLAGALDANGNPYVTEAFIKVLDAGGSWATGQSIFEPLTVGVHSISLLENSGYATPSIQCGYRVYGSNDVSGSATADLAVVIVPEPATMALLGIGGMFLSRRRK